MSEGRYPELVRYIKELASDGPSRVSAAFYNIFCSEYSWVAELYEKLVSTRELTAE